GGEEWDYGDRSWFRHRGFGPGVGRGRRQPMGEEAIAAAGRPERGARIGIVRARRAAVVRGEPAHSHTHTDVEGPRWREDGEGQRRDGGGAEECAASLAPVSRNAVHGPLRHPRSHESPMESCAVRPVPGEPGPELLASEYHFCNR